MQNTNAGGGNFIQKSLQYLIPGYKGYLSANEAADTDSKIRDHIVSSIGEMTAAVDLKKKAFTSSLHTIAFLAALDKITASLGAAAETINYCSGASASFNFSSYDSDRCEKLKTFDEFLYYSLQEIKTIISEIKNASGHSEFENIAARAAEWSAKYIRQIKSRKDIL
jgi:hypothetical protein